MDSESELILVYNADSGFFNAIRDSLHKTLKPQTYQCNLCALTYGRIRMKDEWKRFIDRPKITAEFMHRDEFLRRLETHPHSIKNVSFPAIFLSRDGKTLLLVTAREINECKTLQDLMDLLSRKLKEAPQRKS